MAYEFCDWNIVVRTTPKVRCYDRCIVMLYASKYFLIKVATRSSVTMKHVRSAKYVVYHHTIGLSVVGYKTIFPCNFDLSDIF